MSENDQMTAPETPVLPEPQEPKRRRRVKSRTLFAGAVVLGALGGVAAGYAVQSGRPDTPLPALLPAAPTYGPIGVYAGIAPSPLPSAQDDLTLTDGDLTKLLLPTPAGASVGEAWDHEWVGVVDVAALCDGDSQRYCFTTDMSHDIRAIADAGWTTKSGYYEEVRIVRYGSEYDTSSYLRGIASGGKLVSTPVQLNASAVSFTDASDGEHMDYGAATHGDLVVQFWVSSTTQVPDPSLIDDLMTQQMARL
jgi:hypothetical protein